MNSTNAVNFQSLNMVRDELVATIDESARSLENFVNYQEDGESLQACVNGIKQIVGILRLIQFNGATYLADELLAVATDIMPGNSGPAFEKRLEVVSNSFFVLTRYLEYVQQTERKVNVLLIPQINELRKVRGETPFQECHFFSFEFKALPAPPRVETLVLEGKSLTSTVKRVRHMYHVGLLGYIRERQVKNSLSLMRRAVIRLQRLAGPSKRLTVLWWVADVTMEAMLHQRMAVLGTRKFLFARLDRVIKQVEKSGAVAFSANPPRGLLKELLYLLALSGSESKPVALTLDAFGIKPLRFTDRMLETEREALHGPSAHTVSSLAKVLHSELSNTKKVLESAAQSETHKIDDMDSFIGALDKVAEILAVIGLNAPSGILKEEIQRISEWKRLPDGPESEALSELANTLLYLESTVSSLESSKLSEEKLAEANQVARQEVIASGALAEAERIVIEECEAGLSLTKRAISSFSESSYDIGHIRNIAKTLNSVRGGMIMLNRPRAARILLRCVDFVESVLLDSEQPVTLKELLETFADAIIAVEYYLNSATPSLQMDDTVLQLAEESLLALGQPVSG